jgi:xanthine phosphoribosyltransferase
MKTIGKKACSKKYVKVSWEELHRYSRALARRLASLRKWKGIIAVTRGGLVPAAIVGEELGIRLIDTFCIKSYRGQTQGRLQLLKQVDGDGNGMVVIDDVVDSGKTLRRLHRLLPKAHIATIFAKPDGKNLADTFISEVNQNTWIIFPWDKR